MSVILRQSTQIKVRIGMAVAVGDGFTPVTTLALSTADEAEALKANGAGTVDISGATWAAVTGADGWYDLTLTTSHTDTVGELVIVVNDDSLVLPISRTFQVMTQAAYDAMFGASAAPDGPLMRLTGTAQAGGAAAITLAAGAVAADNKFQGNMVYIRSGTGAGQSAIIQSSTTADDVCVVAPAWPEANPSSDSVYEIYAVGANVVDAVSADVTAISGDATAADNLEAACDGTGFNVGGGSVVAASVTGAVGSVAGHTAQTGDSYAIVSSGTHGNSALKAVMDTSGVTLSVAGQAAATTAVETALNTAIGASPTADSIFERIKTMDAADLPTQVAAILDDTGTAGVVLKAAGLNADAVAKIFTTQLTEAYAADGVAPTAAQALFLILQYLTEVAITGTTMTINKLDGSTPAATLTLDDAVSPTAKTRAT